VKVAARLEHNPAAPRRKFISWPSEPHLSGKSVARFCSISPPETPETGTIACSEKLIS
jgi:hypothetical protein